MTRAGYSAECPNIGHLLANLSFQVADEDVLMGYILDDGMTPGVAAETWLADNPDVLKAWLDGVTTVEGEPAFETVRDRVAG